MENLGRFGHKSLPTYYKGITFRSRLEARWAIVFDELGIKWEYEPEGIEIDGSHFSDPYNLKTFGYLPDFYLPELGCIVEVKGSLTKPEYWKLMRSVHQITGSFATKGYLGMPFILCGNLGNHKHYPMMKSLYNWKGNIYSCRFIEFDEIKPSGDHFTEYMVWIGSDGMAEEEIENKISIDFLTEYLCNSVPSPVRASSDQSLERWSKAIDKARAARFEDGHYV
jgi:hypothetical protein